MSNIKLGILTSSSKVIFRNIDNYFDLCYPRPWKSAIPSTPFQLLKAYNRVKFMYFKILIVETGSRLHIRRDRKNVEINLYLTSPTFLNSRQEYTFEPVSFSPSR